MRIAGQLDMVRASTHSFEIKLKDGRPVHGWTSAEVFDRLQGMLREQVIVLDPPESYVEAYPDLTPTTSVPGGEWYLRPDFGEGVLVSTHRYTEEVDPDDYDGDPDESTLLELTDLVAGSIPELAEAGVRGRYCGVYSVTPDHDFVVDEAGPSGCFLASGFSGHGFKHGPAVGRILRDLVVDGGTDLVDPSFFSLSRFEDDSTGHGLPADNV